ncbi:MAG: D-threo-aldose 1-dehydrogenase [Microbacteriaceae bacterium]|nr:D-threo-aldose 1-dehydrogenase [Microbacteriaceae bacterium]
MATELSLELQGVWRTADSLHLAAVEIDLVLAILFAQHVTDQRRAVATESPGGIPARQPRRRVVHHGPFGLGCAPLGNLFQAIDDGEASALLEAAWDAGIRWFDTAPHYGLGLSERRLGAFLRTKPRQEYTVSTKVGRILVPYPSGAAERDPEGFDVPGDQRRVWDFSGDGVRACLEASLERLGLDSVDVALIHDPSDHIETAISEAYPALAELRDAGSIQTVGVGTRDTDVLKRFVNETDIDTVMLAGRFTLLDQSALTSLFPACLRRGVSVLNAGVFNSGVLASPLPAQDSRFEYATAPSEVLVRARRIAQVCAAFGTTLPAAALAFARQHPAIETVVVGAAHPGQLGEDIAWNSASPPQQLWEELVAQGLLPFESLGPWG